MCSCSIHSPTQVQTSWAEQNLHVRSASSLQTDAHVCVCVWVQVCTRHMKSNKPPPRFRFAPDDTIKRERENWFDKMPLFTIYNKIIMRRKKKKKKIQSSMETLTYKHVCKGLPSCSRRMKCSGPRGQEHFLETNKQKQKSHTSKELSRSWVCPLPQTPKMWPFRFFRSVFAHCTRPHFKCTSIEK